MPKVNDFLVLPGLQLGSIAQASMIIANCLYKDARPAFSAICVYIQGNPAQSRFLGIEGSSKDPLKIKNKQLTSRAYNSHPLDNKC